MTAPLLTLVLGEGAPPFAIATRNAAVPEVFWDRLRVEWGYAGDPARSVRVPMARFRANLGWLRSACEQHEVSLDWDLKLKDVVRQSIEERRQVEALLDKAVPLEPHEVRARLADTRFNRDLRDFQLRDVGRLLALPHGANFSVPGAGKTTVAYAVYEAERVAGKVSQMLVVAPLSAFDAWRSEITECFDAADAPKVRVLTDGDPGDAEVLLVNYHRLAGNFETVVRWVAQAPTLTLLDEAHRMKAGRNGQHGSACLDLAFGAVRRDILTGTPAPQAPNDFLALLDFLWPGQARRLIPRAALASRPSTEAVHDVARAIRPLFVRTRKQELGLTPPRLRVESVPLEGLHRDIYLALRDQYAGEMKVNMTDRVELGRMGAVVMYLLEAATNPFLLATGSSVDDAPEFRHPPLSVEPGSRLWDLLQRYNQYETPTKFVRLAQMVKANAEMGRKTLVWSNFVRNLHMLERMFRGLNPAMIYGGVPSEGNGPPGNGRTREQELRRFRHDDCMVLLANPAAMSEGVSLHMTCHDAIYLDRTFNAGQYLQSIDRIHRLGLDPGVETRLTFLATADTIDDVVNDRIKIKATALGNMLNDPDLVAMALPDSDEEGYGATIDDEADVQALFAHLRGER
ncbi:DEAD/DEAH box helicase [Catellatospora vulcania]|uniref:DEAD/DEAH box helicase n=1 Tax=Catellatospora vulcania TaxID=1460450 RepID=UPI0012D37403|nr:DEAD/DEAH box helicase [Catellatospora vulcania]